MNDFGDRPLGPWDHLFTLQEDIGCWPIVVGFLVFLGVVAALRYFLF
jgi:hypothetical protein